MFSGHLHACARHEYGSVDLITTAALGKPYGNDRSGFAIVKVYRRKIDYEYYELKDVPKKVEL